MPRKSTVERTSERQLTGSTLTTDEKMIDFFRPRRRLLFRRLWRSRCCLVGGKNKMTDCDEWQQKALIRHLTRILSTSQLDTLARVVEQRDEGPCVPVAEDTASSCNEALIDSCCRLWRPCWTTTHDDDDDHTLRRLSICHSSTAVCLNPYHWSVNVTTAISSNCSTVQRGAAGSSPVTESWCRITYHQYRDHVGAPGCYLPVHTDSVHVFSGLHQGDQGLCLSALRPAAAANLSSGTSCLSSGQVAERTLSKVGRGVTLSVERRSHTAWLYNQSEFPVFVLSPTTQVVLKLRPTQSACVYQWPLCDDEDQKTALCQADCIFVSFVKGWSGRYKRQTILSCPCWLQVLLARSLDGSWNEDDIDTTI